MADQNTTKELLEGNAAIAEAAVRAGVEAFFGYPITPQTEVLEHFSRRLPELGRVFLQAESEVAAINMVYGAACAGARVMSSSSSPGISLMQEGLSYIACSEVPVVLVNVMRGGPGLGNIQPSQGDYFQAVKSAGHGDFHMIVLAPASVQEAIDAMVLAFGLAEKYRTIVVVAADGAIGQMMEPAELPPMRPVRPPEERPTWALTGAKGRRHNVITSLYLGAENLERANLRLQENSGGRFWHRWTRLPDGGAGGARERAERGIAQAHHTLAFSQRPPGGARPTGEGNAGRGDERWTDG